MTIQKVMAQQEFIIWPWNKSWLNESSLCDPTISHDSMRVHYMTLQEDIQGSPIPAPIDSN